VREPPPNAEPIHIDDDKYLHTEEDTIMGTNDDQDDERFDNDIESQRNIIRQTLNEIVNDIGMVMRDAGLRFPVYITARTEGDSLATIATPVDPSNEDWERASAIACQVIGRKIGDRKLRHRELVCAVANAAPISAAEVTAG
jgi:hypothetical protein